ncbi:hypothetical protein ACQCT3_17660 [Sutcliffiella horikoshii]
MLQSTAINYPKDWLLGFSVASNKVRRLTDRPQASEAPGTEINGIMLS